MTPRDKAKELVSKFNIQSQNKEYAIKQAKLCALIASDEILKLLYEIPFGHRMVDFWNETKQAITNIN